MFSQKSDVNKSKKFQNFVWKFSYNFFENLFIMFVISKMTSIVRIEPKSFGREMPDVITDVLNAKLANKVLKDVGLVVLQDCWCCPSICGSCTLYFGREGVPQVEWMAMIPGCICVVVLVRSW